MIDSFSEVISVSGIISGLIAFMIAYVFYYRKRLKHTEKQIEYLSQQIKNITLANLSSIVQVERSIGKIDTNAFRFHGITKEEIDDAKLSKEELAYLVASFTAGRIYDACVYPEASMSESLPDYHYRYKMLAQEDTRNAWPLIARMMTCDAYVTKLELTIDKIVNLQTHR